MIHVISTTAIPTPPPQRGYGGIELLVYNLVDELEKMGEKVSLYAAKNSYRPRHGLYTADSEHGLAKQAVDNAKEGDVIIDWSHTKPISSMQLPKGVKVFSQVFWTDALGMNPVFPSKAVARAFGHPNPTIIYPGIKVSEYPVSKEKEDFFLYFGRIIPEKGVERVIAIARQTGVRLIVAGHTGQFSYDKDYISNIKEACTGKVEFMPDPDHRTKVDLLTKAMAVVHFPRWLESFWIVGVEALACGTPIITTVNSGGPAELGNSLTTYLLTNPHTEFSRVVDELFKTYFDPDKGRRLVSECRSSSKRFDSKVMANQWLNLIKKGVDGVA